MSLTLCLRPITQHRPAQPVILESKPSPALSFRPEPSPKPRSPQRSAEASPNPLFELWLESCRWTPTLALPSTAANPDPDPGMNCADGPHGRQLLPDGGHDRVQPGRQALGAHAAHRRGGQLRGACCRVRLGVSGQVRVRLGLGRCASATHGVHLSILAAIALPLDLFRQLYAKRLDTAICVRLAGWRQDSMPRLLRYLPLPVPLYQCKMTRTALRCSSVSFLTQRQLR